MMSNFIPMVSASPPPFDDHSFGGDNDDDFGTFTGADDSHESSPGPPEPTPFEPDFENKSTSENTKNNNPKIHNLNNKNDNANKLQEIPESEALVNGTEESDEFTNSEQCEINQNKDISAKKPHIENLPIQSVGDKSTESCSEAVEKNLSESKDLLQGQHGKRDTSNNGSCDYKSPTCDKDAVQSCITGSRDSTTDSGMFSTDISPVPKSEDTAELCDRSCDSDNDDTFPDLPKDKTESTDSLPISDTDDLKSEVDSTVVESDTRTSSVLETCSNVDEFASDGSRENSSVVNQPNVKEEGDTVIRDDQTALCSSTDQQVSSLNTQDDSQLLSEQNDKSSQDVSSGQVDNDDEDEYDDWGDFDTADDETKDIERDNKVENRVVDLKLPDVSTISEENINSYADAQSEEDCGKAIDEALKDTDSVGVTDLGEPELEGGGVSDVELSEDESKLDSETNVCKPSNSPEDTVEEKPFQVDEKSCDNVPEGRAESVSDTESDQDNKCAEETSDPTQDTQEDKSVGFVAQDDEWNAFDEVSESTGDGGDNWADFQDFQAPHPEPPQSRDESQKVPDVEGDEDSDFGDFSTPKQEPNTNTGDNGGGLGEIKDFDDEEGNWADFEESDSLPVQSSQIPTKSATPKGISSVPHAHSKVSSEKLENIFSTCFPSSDVRDMIHSYPSQLEVLISDKPQQGTLSMHISGKPSRRGPHVIWGSLQNLDKTNALVYQWSSSTGNTCMFKTLHIDTQNILFGHKKQSVPIFASSIGLLEPIRGSTDIKPLQPKPSPTLVDPDKADNHTGGSQELPPVEFDWDNSGLTNPLTAEGSEKPSPVYGEISGPVISSSMSKTLDLDFLSVQETENVNKNTVFQSEILDAPRSSVKSLPPLEDVLRNMKTTTTTRRRQEEHLSEEAGRIIDSLPILSFMTAKVLMFPLRQANE